MAAKKKKKRKSGGSKPQTKIKKQDLEEVEGLVLSVMGKGYRVEVQGEEWICRPRGRLFMGRKKSKPIVGDRVMVSSMGEAQKGIINEILDRHSFLSRKSSETGKQQVLVSNIDQVLICTALEEPPFRPSLVDRYLVTCEASSLEPVIILNKTDLVPREWLDEELEPFEDIGYRVLCTSAKTGEGIEELRELLKGRKSVFTGPSGAGKSSLANVLDPSVNLKIGSVNELTGKGRHTTTVTSLIPFAGGYIMDTPGIREFALWGVELDSLVSYFREMKPFLGNCYFRDCRHLSEPNCAVKSAVEEGLISYRRYDSFAQLYDELEEAIPKL